MKYIKPLIEILLIGGKQKTFLLQHFTQAALSLFACSCLQVLLFNQNFSNEIFPKM